jgi:DNA-binding MarR family transcriptional regulator
MGSLKDEIKQVRPFSSREEESLLSILRTADFLSHQLAQRLKEYEITPTQYNVLRILRGSLPEGLTCSEIGRRMVKSVPDVTRLIDRMEILNWVERQRDKGDRRVVMIKLTPEGLGTVNLLDQPVDGITKSLMDGLTVKEMKQLNEILEKLRRS